MIEYESLNLVNNSFRLAFEKAFARFLDTGWYVLGKGVEDFEKEYAQFCATQHAVGVANGLDALVLCLQALDLAPGGEVIVPSNTYIASILAIVQAGLVPVLVEPRLDTYNLNPSLLGSALSARTCAVMPVHLYGKLCEMNAIVEFARAHKLKVVEDCAQAHGAHFKGKKAGSWGDVNAHSFYPTKNLGALGDAGAVTTDSALLAERIRSIRNYGSRIKYHNEVVGRNSRLDEIQAVFLSIKLRQLNEINNHKRRLATIYQEEIAGNFVKPVVQGDYWDVFHIYNIRHPERDRLRAYLLEKGIKTEVHYPIPPHQQLAMQGLLVGEYPIAEEIHRTTLSLPISYGSTEADVREVCRALNAF